MYLRQEWRNVKKIIVIICDEKWWTGGEEAGEILVHQKTTVYRDLILAQIPTASPDSHLPFKITYVIDFWEI